MLKSVLLILLFTVVSSGSSATLKLAATDFSFSGIASVWVLAKRWSAWAGMFLHGAASVLWLLLLRDYDFSYIFPVVSALLYIAVIGWGKVLFKETLTPVRIAGIVLLLAGTIVASIT